MYNSTLLLASRSSPPQTSHEDRLSKLSTRASRVYPENSPENFYANVKARRKSYRHTVSSDCHHHVYTAVYNSTRTPTVKPLPALTLRSLDGFYYKRRLGSSRRCCCCCCLWRSFSEQSSLALFTHSLRPPPPTPKVSGFILNFVGSPTAPLGGGGGARGHAS